MAKKSTNPTLHNLGGTLALISVFITGGVFLINLILGLFDGSFNAGLLNTVASIAMLIAIVIISWASLVRASLPGNKNVWYLFYWAFVILAFIGVLPL